jgi:hypothetical protein
VTVSGSCVRCHKRAAPAVVDVSGLSRAAQYDQRCARPALCTRLCRPCGYARACMDPLVGREHDARHDLHTVSDIPCLSVSVHWALKEVGGRAE